MKVETVGGELKNINVWLSNPSSKKVCMTYKHWRKNFSRISDSETKGEIFSNASSTPKLERMNDKLLERKQLAVLTLQQRAVSV